MKKLLIALFVLICSPVFAQKPTLENLKEAMDAVYPALIAKDTNTLKSLLDDDVSYGHSNGWVQTKREVIADLFTNKIIYTKVSSVNEYVHIDGKIAYSRDTVDMDAIIEGKPMHFYLNLLQIWQFKNKSWIMFARQSVAVFKNSPGRKR